MLEHRFASSHLAYSSQAMVFSVVGRRVAMTIVGPPGSRFPHGAASISTPLLQKPPFESEPRSWALTPNPVGNREPGRPGCDERGP